MERDAPALAAALAKLAEFERLQEIELRRHPEVIVAVPPRHEVDRINFRLPRERDHTAPRSPRQSFKKSSKR